MGTAHVDDSLDVPGSSGDVMTPLAEGRSCIDVVATTGVIGVVASVGGPSYLVPFPVVAPSSVVISLSSLPSTMNRDTDFLCLQIHIQSNPRSVVKFSLSCCDGQLWPRFCVRKQPVSECPPARFTTVRSRRVELFITHWSL